MPPAAEILTPANQIGKRSAPAGKTNSHLRQRVGGGRVQGALRNNEAFGPERFPRSAALCGSIGHV